MTDSNQRIWNLNNKDEIKLAKNHENIKLRLSGTFSDTLRNLIAPKMYLFSNTKESEMPWAPVATPPSLQPGQNLNKQLSYEKKLITCYMYSYRIQDLF